MTNCKNCGAPIPDGQRGLCSMCVGDIDHGRDGYYRQQMEEEERRRREQEDAWRDDFQDWRESGN